MRDSRRTLTEAELLATIDAGWEELHALALATARSSHVVDKLDASPDTEKAKGRRKRGRARNAAAKSASGARPKTA